MGMALKDKVVIWLTRAQREALGSLLHGHNVRHAAWRRANILVFADADGPESCTDKEIADRLETTRMTAQRVRHQYAHEGLDATLHRKKPTVVNSENSTANRRSNSSH